MAKEKTKTDKVDSTIWTEKYRPRDFNEVFGHAGIVSRVKAFVSEKNLPHLLFAGPAGCGKCVASETPILVGDGRILPIEKCFKERIREVMTLDTNGKIIKTKINYLYKNKADSLIRIKTRSGNHIKVTPEHPFLVLRKGKPIWIEAQFLKKKDLVAIPLCFNPELKDFIPTLKNPNFWAILKNNKQIPLAEIKNNKKIKTIYYKSRYHRPSSQVRYLRKITPDFLEWFGMVLADGNIRNASIRFYNTNKKSLRKFEELSLRIFGPNIALEEKITHNVPYVEIMKATTITKFLEEVFDILPNRKKADLIEIHNNIFSLDKQSVASFIRGFYECDGSYYNNVVEFSSASRNFVYNLKYLLLRFNIHSTIRKKKKQFYLIISGSNNIKKFRDNIRPVVKKIEYPLAECPQEENTNIDILDINTKKTKTVLKMLGIKLSQLGRKNEIEYVFWRGRASRKKIQEIYRKIIKIARIKIMNGLEAISILDSLDLREEDFSYVLSCLKESKIRKNVWKKSKIRYDRLKEYWIQKREPNLCNLIKILKAMMSLKISNSNEIYNKLMKVLLLRRKVVTALESFSISYNELASPEISSSNINYYLNKDGLSLQALKKTLKVFSQIKGVIESRILNKEIIETLENIDFLSKAELLWDRINFTEKIDGGVVYDLNIAKTHNFIGGHGALILHNTTLALVAAKKLFGSSWHENFFELNASDTRGIDVIRQQVKAFARTKALGEVPFKIILLDESDALTKEAQHALRRIMEMYTETCRFILSCNASGKIIDPIQSRCAVFRFKLLEKEDIAKVVEKIAREEKIKIDGKAVEALYDLSKGDLRRVINILQASTSITKNINEKTIYETAAIAKPQDIRTILDLALAGKFLEARNKLLDIMLKQGLSGLDIIKAIQHEIWNLNISQEKKIKLIEKCGEIEFRLVEGSDEFIQLEALLASFIF